MRKTLAIIFAVTSILMLIVAVLFNPNSTGFSVSETIANSHEIEKSFLIAAEFTENFRREEDGLPKKTEFDTWNRSHSDYAYASRDMFIETDLEHIKIRMNNPRNNFGEPPEASYIIGIWRGEWHEYYVSWKHSTTLEFDPKAYYLTGSPIKDFIFLIFLFLIFAATSIWLWLSHNRALDTVRNG